MERERDGERASEIWREKERWRSERWRERDGESDGEKRMLEGARGER